MKIIDGKAVSTQIKEEIRLEVEALLKQGKKKPHLAAILVGNDPASHTYVNHKIKACHYVGFDSSLIRLDDSISEEKLLEEIDKVNRNENIDGLIVQLPLPANISVQKVIEKTDYKKDVDGFHPVNAGRMMKMLPAYIPATPLGILKIIEHYQIETEGKHCVVVGRSQIVGLPSSILMGLDAKPGNCTVTLCHKATRNLKEKVREADILITAVGKPGLISKDMIKEGAVVLDVGITRVIDSEHPKGFRLKGDVDFDEVAPLTSWITPVPGGVGPMTIASLLINTLKASKNEVFPML